VAHWATVVVFDSRAEPENAELCKALATNCRRDDLLQRIRSVIDLQYPNNLRRIAKGDEDWHFGEMTYCLASALYG
jgi:hypothetical protein